MANLNGGGFWRTMYGVFRISRTLAIVIALAVSLAVNATLFVGGVLYNFVDDFLEDATGLQTASAKQRKVVRSLQKENRQLRGQIKKVRTVARTAAERTMKRSVKWATQSVATLPGKALPLVGAAVSVGVTTWEIKHLCDTIKDMNSIRREIDPSEATADSKSTVCSMPVPSAKRIPSQIKISPRKAWEESKNFVSDLNFPTSVRDFPAERWKDIKSILSTYRNKFYFRRDEDSDRGN